MAMIYALFLLNLSLDSSDFTLNLQLEFRLRILETANLQFYSKALKSVDLVHPIK
jgi:hypothetical protein